MPGLGGVCSQGSAPGGGGCLLPGAWSWGVSGPRGSLLLGGCLVCGGGISVCTKADPPAVNRITDRCKNITFATSLRMVTRMHSNRICTYRCRMLLSELNLAPNQ